jgi:hypothetical protein
MKDLILYLVGLEVWQRLEKIFLNQGKYATVEGKSPCGQVDLLLRARLLNLKTENA